MRTTSGRRILAIGGAVLLLAVMTAGCARRSLPGSSAANAPVASLAAVAASPESPIDSTSSKAVATPASTQAPTPAAMPVATPDLSAIDGLIKDIDNEIGADASAGADEGTMP